MTTSPSPATSNEPAVEDREQLELLAHHTSAVFTRLTTLVAQRVDDSGVRSRGWALHRTAHQLTTRATGEHFDTQEFSPRAQALLDAIAAVWQNELSNDERLALFVHGLWINPYAATITEVLAACHLAGQHFHQSPDELTRLESGHVQLLRSGRCSAEIGIGTAAVTLGQYDHAGAAYNAAHDAISHRRNQLRDLMTTGPKPLQHLAAMDWHSPSITGWQPAEQTATTDELELVSIEQIALRAGVRRPTVDQWIARHRAFPSGLGGTTARSWTAVAQWLHETGRMPVTTDTPSAEPVDNTANPVAPRNQRRDA